MKKEELNIPVSEQNSEQQEIKVRFIGNKALMNAQEQSIVKVDIDKLEAIPYTEGVPDYDQTELEAA